VVCYGEFEGQQVLGLKMNFSKRWITLAPVATVVGLAFKLYDPDGLLGDKTKLSMALPVHLYLPLMQA
jgi:acyl-CoA dehydrogenase